MKRIICFLIIICIHISLFAFASPVKGEEKFKTYSYDDVIRSVGHIVLKSNGEMKHLSNAFIVHEDEKYSYVASNYIVSSTEYEKTLNFYNIELDIEFVGADKTIDISIFRFLKEEYRAPVLKFASSEKINVGERVFFAGIVGIEMNLNQKNYLYSKEQTFISKKDVLYCENQYLYTCSNLMLLDFNLTSQVQGGPVFNQYGYVIGMMSMHNPASNLEGGNKLYHATLSNDIQIFINRILNKNLNRADIGIYFQKIENITYDKKKILNIKQYNTGTLVTATMENASLSGLDSNCVITKINGIPVPSTGKLVSELYKYDKGTVIRIQARNNIGKLKTYYIKG